MKTHTEWLPEQVEFLKQNYQVMTNKEIAEALGKTQKSIMHRAVKLGLKKLDKGVHIGDRFGKLEVINEQFMKPVGKTKQSYVECKCDCGNIEIIRVYELKESRRTCLECGRVKYEIDPEQRLVPLGPEEMRNGARFAEYKCSCGKIKWIRKQTYLNSQTKSCGCLNQDKRLARKGVNNAGFKHGLTSHLLYGIYANIKSKCFNNTIDSYHGGNIGICREWLDDFMLFYNWAMDNGWKESLCISRKDYKLDYSPENCEVLTKEEIYNKEEVKINMQKGLTASLLEKYNVEFSRHIPGVDAKIKKTNMEKYGSESPLGNKEIQQKAWDTNIKNHGQRTVPYELNREKTIKTNQERYGFDYVTQNEEVRKKQVATRIKRGLIYLHDGLKAHEWSEKVGICPSAMRKRIRDFGFEEAIKIPKRQSGIEYKLEQFLKESNINYEGQKSIGGKFPDFVLNDYSLIIETDGLYWHSDAINADKKYHVKKKKIYKENGYNTMFFREDEIEEKFEIVKSIILNKVGLNTNKIFGRKTVIVELSKKEANIFFRNNHLMGKGSGKCYALKHKNKVVSAIRINKRMAGLEISRFCNILNTTVIGGYSKLISHIERVEKPELIKTFVDLRYGDGEYLKELGFEKIRQHLSFKWVLDSKTFSRQKFPGNTGYENRCFKIWDCGQALWQKKIPVLPESK